MRKNNIGHKNSFISNFYRLKIYINLRSKCNIIKLMISKVIILFIIWIKINNWNNNSYFFYIYAAYYTILFSSFLCLSIKLLVHLSQAWNFCQNQYYSLIVLPSKTIEKLRINCYFDLETNYCLTINRKYSIDFFIPLRKKTKKQIKDKIKKAARQRKEKRIQRN